MLGKTKIIGGRSFRCANNLVLDHNSMIPWIILF
uniref:Uncharacterized protein n=1 Tax=Heterorhabditis bacteriophora TaxID=37862 RepID=A0A1I7W9X8_HETBA